MTSLCKGMEIQTITRPGGRKAKGGSRRLSTVVRVRVGGGGGGSLAEKQERREKEYCSLDSRLGRGGSTRTSSE